MKIEFEDGLVFNFTGSIHITKGNDVDITIKEEFVPVRLKADLNQITSQINREIKKIAMLITDTIGCRICLADDSEDWAACLASLESAFADFGKDYSAGIQEKEEPFCD
jgi:hypothetical protein